MGKSKKGVRKKIHKAVNKAEPGDQLSQFFDYFIVVLILINVVAVIAETVPSLKSEYGMGFYVLELTSVIIFTIEYLIRLWTCVEFPKYSHPFYGRLRYIFSLEALIDLLAIIPFYLPILFAFDSRSVRALRLFRLLRIFKLGRYSEAIGAITGVFRQRREELLITFSFVLILLIIASTFMYFIENEAQPEAFVSIPATMWWGVATLTTVGYGDIYPVTALGKLLGAFIAILGIGVFALPAGIIATGFESELASLKKAKKEIKEMKQIVCPHCESIIHPDDLSEH
ncbi:MAG: ion transporter [Bacteroidota bacterium]